MKPYKEIRVKVNAWATVKATITIILVEPDFYFLKGLKYKCIKIINLFYCIQNV